MFSSNYMPQRLELDKTSLSSPPLPPSYDTVHFDVTRTISNDAISYPSAALSSSDEFEDITKTDLESQWELDHMVGFTLEECVRREWRRQQVARENVIQPVASSLQLPRSTKTTPEAPKAKEIYTTHQKPPSVDHLLRSPAKPSSATPLNDTSGPSTQRVLSGNVSPLSLTTFFNSASSLEDWEILEPCLPSSSFPGQNREVSQALQQEHSVSDVESFSTLSSSSSSREGHSETLCAPCTESTSNACSPMTSMPGYGYSGNDDTVPRAIDLMEHKTKESGEDPKWSAIHSRPLPTPPISVLLNHVRHLHHST